MTSSAPYCNVSVAEPAGDPTQPKGFQKIPPGATPDQMANIINNNFALLAKGNFTEDKGKRVVQIVRLKDAQNPSAFVDVEQVNSVTFRNPQTGQTVLWKR